MPELPEVETVLNGLRPALEHKHIEHVELRRGDLRWPLPENMGARLTGSTVENMTRRSKYILIGLSSGETWLIHLGMSGRIQVEDRTLGQFHHFTAMEEKHRHVIVKMREGACVSYIDPRRFGAMDLCATAQIENHVWLRNLGPEPLGNHFNLDVLFTAFQRRAAPVKNVLLDQKTVAGLGNIYVCEALFEARIHPNRPAKEIAKEQVETLYHKIVDVLRQAIAAGGSTLRDHQQVDGSLGYFQHNFQVYGREGAPCFACDGKSEIRKIVQAGRSSFFCDHCQS